MTDDSISDSAVSCKMLHHGAAASSSSHSIAWIPSRTNQASSLVYSSHGILNICERTSVRLKNQTKINDAEENDSKEEEPVWQVENTLRTSSLSTADASKRVITALTSIANATGEFVALSTGFSDGTVNIWWQGENNAWEEKVVEISADDQVDSNEESTTPPPPTAPITDLDGVVLNRENVVLVACTAQGVHRYSTTKNGGFNHDVLASSFSANVVRAQHIQALDQVILLVGTAAPRYNKIHVYWMDSHNGLSAPRYRGHLMGHEDWLTSFAWHLDDNVKHFETTASMWLASASQDCRIRIWEFRTTTGFVGDENDESMSTPSAAEEGPDYDLEGENDDDEEEEEEGEARLEVYHNKGVTRVTLEALLYGHEEPVTSVAWHPNPKSLYNQDRVLISSSMDRTLLIWTCSTGVWTPLTRVGAAGGILGGSVGSTLLGFVGAGVDPVLGDTLVGHAYGGALHIWSLETQDAKGEEMTPEELAVRNKWRATPCITGHFEAVTDCAWEASCGEYLLTVSNDQTCRLWGPVETVNKKEVWVELARPQVHGYDLTTVTSISNPQHKHLTVTGADEKEIRAFDAPLTTTKMLRAIKLQDGYSDNPSEQDGLNRVDRAYIPSLGLSNKASADDGAEEDTEGASSDDSDSRMVHLPLERDLGAVSLWPETRKLYGHNTELFCLTSTLTAKIGPDKYVSGPCGNDILVASSAKARDVADASIRLWDVEKGKCLKVLSGGHRSTIASLAFSPDGLFLASSGKDRRLCIWKRNLSLDEISFSLVSAVDSAHKRIIWSVHFCPHHPHILASGSRDGCIKIWRVNSKDDSSAASVDRVFSFEALSRTKSKAESVTALAFAPYSQTENVALLAVGLGCGLIEFWNIPLESLAKPSLCGKIPHRLCHTATVTKLSWKPLPPDITTRKLVLASSSTDHGCRLYSVSFDTDEA